MAGLAVAGDLPPEVKALQDKFSAYLQSISSATDGSEADRNRKVLKVLEQYDAKLAEYQRKYEAAGRSKELLAVKDERERAAADPVVTAAEFEDALAEGAADAPVVVAEAPPADTAPEEPPAEASAAPPAAEDEPASSAAEVVPEEPAAPSPPALNASDRAGAPPAGSSTRNVRVSKPGQRVALEEGAYRRLTLSRTDNSTLSSPLLVNASGMAASDVKRQDSDHNRQEDIRDSWSLRLQVRTTQVAGTVTGCAVVVQFFIKSADPKGRIVPECALVKRVDLPRLVPEAITLDYPPVETRMVRQRLGMGTVWQYQGKEFYGTIISVFDPGMNLLYQGVSTRGLADLASNKLPVKGMQERLEEARLIESAAREHLNEARMTFFANQRIQANRDAFLEAARVHEEAKRHLDQLQNKVGTL